MLTSVSVESPFAAVSYLADTLLTQEDTQISEEEQKQTNLLQLSYIRTNGYMDLCRIFCFVPDSRNLHPVIAATVETAKKFNIPLQVFE